MPYIGTLAGFLCPHFFAFLISLISSPLSSLLAMIIDVYSFLSLPALLSSSCRSVLCSQDVVDFLQVNFLSWGASILSPREYKYVPFCIRVIGQRWCVFHLFLLFQLPHDYCFTFSCISIFQYSSGQKAMGSFFML